MIPAPVPTVAPRCLPLPKRGVVAVDAGSSFHPADGVWLLLLAVGLGADVPLLRGGFASVSDRAGCTWWRRALVGYLAAHFLGLVPHRWDPLGRLADGFRDLKVAVG